MLFAFGVIATLEGVPTHLFVSTWSVRWAWVLTASDGYVVLWLAAAYQAARLRPMAVVGDRFVVRCSLLWTAYVPRDQIATVETANEIARGPGVLRAALGAPPVLLVTLRNPVEARGPLGIRRQVSRIAPYVDDARALRSALAAGDADARVTLTPIRTEPLGRCRPLLAQSAQLLPVLSVQQAPREQTG